MRFLKIALSIVIGVGIAASCGFAGYYLVSFFSQQKKDDDNNHSTQSINAVSSNVWKNFCQSNSLKLSMQRGNNISDTEVPVSQGTAWSWYYTWNAHDQIFDWYLMTNFHVINEVAYWSDFNSQNYINKSEVHVNRNSYISLGRYNQNSYNEYIPLKSQYFDSASLIYDVKTSSDNDNPVLFSVFNSYTLDMALVKLSFSFNYTDLFERNNVINPVQDYIRLYRSYLSREITKAQLDDKTCFKPREYTTVIGGNPADSEQLIINKIESNVSLWWIEKYINLNYTANGVDANLSYLKAPYMQTSASFDNWNLTEGSSGSAVFQTQQNLDTMTSSDVYNLIPVGIYWGGFGRTSSNFYPSIIPFVYSSKNVRYNIYLNFIQNYLNINMDA